MAKALLGVPAVDSLLAGVRSLEQGARLLDLPPGLLDVDLLGTHRVVDEDDRAVLLHLEVAGAGSERLPLALRRAP